MRSENGSDDIISKRSKIIQESHVDIDSMKIDELITFIKRNPVSYTHLANEFKNTDYHYLMKGIYRNG